MTTSRPAPRPITLINTGPLSLPAGTVIPDGLTPSGYAQTLKTFRAINRMELAYYRLVNEQVKI